MKPRNEYVIIAPDPNPETAGSILIPDIAQSSITNDNTFIKEWSQYHFGTVLAVGPGIRTKKGVLIRPDVSEGDRVIYHRASSIPVDDSDAIMIRDDGIVGVIQDE